MNVTGSVLNRLVQNQIDETNNRGGIGLDFRSARAVAFPQLHKLAHFPELFQHLLHA